MGKTSTGSKQSAGPQFNTKQRISAHTTNYTVTEGESGTLFTNEAASAEVVFTLPAAANGLFFEFFAAEDFSIVVVGDTADLVVVFNDVTADQIAMNASDNIVGGGFKVWSDGTKWYVAEYKHDGQTAAIAT